MQTLILINGLPFTGKTTLAKIVSNELNIVWLTKDEIKESLFDSLGISDRDWSKKIGLASFQLQFFIANKILKTGQNIILESVFSNEFSLKTIIEFQNTYNLKLIQIYCKSEGQTLYNRFKKRAESSERHNGHVDNQNYQEFESILINGIHKPLNIQGETIELDTTNLTNIDYDSVLNKIKMSL